MTRPQSEQLFAEALRYIPGGVNSPVRAFRAVGGNPFFINRAAGCKLWDVDGNELIDYVLTWGPAILGHAHPKIISAIKAAAEMGTSFGIPNPLEVKMAKLICGLVPSVQKVRMTNSGTEACMSAIRLARGFTRRDKIIKFDGCYHGRAEIMDYFAPLGPVYQAGTLSGNPIAMAAGITNLEELQATNAYEKLEQLGAQLAAGMRDAARSANIPVQFNRCGSMFCGYFTDAPVHNLADALRSDRERFKKFFHGMLDAGVYLAPSQFESGFISTAHSAADIEKTVAAAAKVLRHL